MFCIDSIGGGQKPMLAVKCPHRLNDLAILHKHGFFTPGSDHVESFGAKMFAFGVFLKCFRFSKWTNFSLHRVSL